MSSYTVRPTATRHKTDESSNRRLLVRRRGVGLVDRLPESLVGGGCPLQRRDHEAVRKQLQCRCALPAAIEPQVRHAITPHFPALFGPVVLRYLDLYKRWEKTVGGVAHYSPAL